MMVHLRQTPLRFIASFALLVSVPALSHAQASSTTSQQQPATNAENKVGKYNGPGACAASGCHGSVQPKTITRINQNEYSIWASQDKHARAYAVLSNPVSQRIGKILNLQQPPNKTERCLACHALAVPPQARAQTFSLDDGVSCENCHGPAVGWLGQHTTKNWKHEDSLKLGMYDTRNIASRTEKCLTCHLGTPDKQVDHELIAAGHPDLTFELDSFSAAMPRHWKPKTEKDPWETVQEWSVGQAVQLRESLNRLSRRASSQNWPEFGEMECFACHHNLTKPEDSWRQDRGYTHRAGSLPWNAARYIVFRHVAAEVDPPSSKQLETELNRISDLIARMASPQEIAQSAQKASGLANDISTRLQQQKYDQALTARVLNSIAADSRNIAASGERSAEQAAMALESLSLAYAKNVKLDNAQELRAAIMRLFQQLDNPSAYNGPRFASQMDKIRALLPRTSVEAEARR